MKFHEGKQFAIKKSRAIDRDRIGVLLDTWAAANGSSTFVARAIRVSFRIDFNLRYNDTIPSSVPCECNFDLTAGFASSLDRPMRA